MTAKSSKATVEGRRPEMWSCRRQSVIGDGEVDGKGDSDESKKKMQILVDSLVIRLEGDKDLQKMLI
ncbi:hypothetical protein L6452_09426 [Arctium lappa]|uniref:Uncharacterized protein n=1 Tax=Arctium lappa TaxID=4217 RepID=A0ACB9DK04_ARCLA|nr:hypothetical protein L6452_09426 [Arctium lappa]